MKMEKNRIIIVLLLICDALFCQQTSNSYWTHVGPRSYVNTSNVITGGFETAQFSSVSIDPNNSSHLFAASKFGGLWESTDGGTNWSNIDSNPTGINGIISVGFIDNTSILVGNFHPSNYGRDYSTQAYKYTFGSTPGWTQLGSLPSGGAVYTIRSVAVHPGNSSILFVCTSIGLFRSTNGGSTWTKSTISSSSVTDCFVENIVFVAATGGSSASGYYCYIAGSDAADNHSLPHGKSLVQESYDDGSSFADISNSLKMDPSVNIFSHSKICVGPLIPGHSVGQQLFLYTITAPGTGSTPYWDTVDPAYSSTYLQRLEKTFTDLRGVVINSTPSNSDGYDICVGIMNSNIYGHHGYGPPDKMAVNYDIRNDLVWFGGITINCVENSTYTYHVDINSNSHTIGGLIHNDMHDIQIDVANSFIYVAHDGGLVKGSLQNILGAGLVLINFKNINNGLHVAMLRGFSGSQQHPTIYASSGQDIVNTDIYDDTQGIQANKHTLRWGENDGVIIDKFNDQLIISDNSSYNVGTNPDPKYHVSSDQGSTWPVNNGFYKPQAGSTFGADLTQPTADQDIKGFVSGQWYQDPYRPGRIFMGKGYAYNGVEFWETQNSGVGISQFDFAKKAFAVKFLPCLIQPNVTTGTWVTGDWITSVNNFVGGMSFSQQSPNGFHFTMNASIDDWDNQPGSTMHPSKAAIIKYIGTNFDGTWLGHGDDHYNSSNPQWTNIVPDFANFSTAVTNCSGCAPLINVDAVDPTYNLYRITLPTIETSPWNQDVVYVMANIPTNPSVKILKYDGASWVNYSNGLPANEDAYSMIMDHASNDGIYLATDLGVYYRDATMNAWVPYNNNFPKLCSNQLEINYTENTVRAGTFGRGIWKSNMVCPSLMSLNVLPGTVTGFKEAWTITTSNGSSNSVVTGSTGPTIFRGISDIVLLPGFTAAPTSSNNYFQAYIHGCDPSTGTSNAQYYRSSSVVQSSQSEEEEEEEHKMESSEARVYPNPNTGSFMVRVGNDEEKTISVTDVVGRKLYESKTNEEETMIKLPTEATGIYFVKIVQGNKTTVRKILVE